MDELRSLYDHIENPIDNKFKWNKILNIYSSSLDYNDFLEHITDHNKSINTYYAREDKETYLMMMWSLFKKDILAFDEETIDEYIEKKYFDSDILDAIGITKNAPSVENYVDLENILKNDVVVKYFSRLFFENNHNIVVLSNFDIERDYNYNTVFTITLGSMSLYKFLIKLSNNLFEHELPLYMKFNECGKYINVNIYTTVLNSKKVENVIDILQKENYSFTYDNYYNLLSGDINNILSIRNRNYFNENDYTNNRCMILFKSFDSVIFNYVVNHLTILVSYKGGRMNLLDYISNIVTDRVVQQLVKTSVKTETDYLAIVNSKDLGTFRAFINDKIYSSLKDVLKDKLYLRDGEDKITIKLTDKKSLDIDCSVYMYAIRSLTPTLLLKDYSIEKSFRIRIKNECGYVKVDPSKFCLDASFTKKALFDENKMTSYERKVKSIKNDINRLNDLEKLFKEEDTPDNRKKISTSMQELMNMFEE